MKKQIVITKQVATNDGNPMMEPTALIKEKDINNLGLRLWLIFSVRKFPLNLAGGFCCQLSCQRYYLWPACVEEIDNLKLPRALPLDTLCLIYHYQNYHLGSFTSDPWKLTLWSSFDVLPLSFLYFQFLS